MRAIVLGAGMMGKAIAYDLHKHSKLENIAISDKDKKTLQSAENSLGLKDIDYHKIDAEKIEQVRQAFKNYDIAISALPYKFNYMLAKTAVETNTHFVDLGGNNGVVEKERGLHKKAKKNDVTVIPDCGLAPGLVSVITRDVVEQMDTVDYVKIRVGGLPANPEPPLNYQIVFSPYGLINEYVEDSIILSNGKIITKKSMTEIETIDFPKPFGKMEAFFTSGGCSTLPYTYKNKIKYLDYKTIRYPGHCEKFKAFLDIGFANEKKMKFGDQNFSPRDILVKLLMICLPTNGRDIVLLKVLSRGKKNNKTININYSMIDYCDSKNNISAMMRTTGYPTSIIAQMIERNVIKERCVFCCEEIVPCKKFFEELNKRNIKIKKKTKS